MSRKEVRIAVVGSTGVGKSSIITALISETFQEKVAPVVPPLTIPAEVTPEKVTTHIIDTSSRPSDYPSVEEEIRQADCVIVVYAVDDTESFSKVKDFWLPEIRRIRKEVTNEEYDNFPVVLVGNKIDTKTKTSPNFFEHSIKPIMSEFKEVESCVECSAKKVLHINEVFVFAQKAVIYPTGVLYDHVENKLRPLCIVAIKRIFSLCDKDKDGVLNDAELGEFQEYCFGVSLSPAEIDAVKQVIRNGFEEGVTDTGLNVAGFMYLHHIFIQKGKGETTWTVLKKFGYGDNLKLREEFLCPERTVTDDKTVELSTDGYKFFTHLFKQFDKDKDGSLSLTELEDLFSTSPGIPWGKTTENTVTNEQGYLTLQGFLAQWSMITLLDYKTTLRYLAYLGYRDDPWRALTVQKRRKSDIRKRNVFLIYVFGQQDCGKTTFLNRLVGKSFEEEPSPLGSKTVCNAVYVEKTEKYLVLQEFESEDAEKQVMQSAEAMEKCDLACLLYDTHNPKSFEFVASLLALLYDQKTIDFDVPCIFIGTKTDLGAVKQSYAETPEEFCKRHRDGTKLKSMSLKKKNSEKEAEIFSGLIQDIYDFHQTTSQSKWAFILGAGLFAMLIAGGAFYAYKHTAKGPINFSKFR